MADDKLILRGTLFERVWSASGAQGFFGEGYWFHRWLQPLGLTWEGMTFTAKTTTLLPRAGNMPLKADGITPRERFPRCIVVKPVSGHVLNAVGLSGPGAAALFANQRWEHMPGNFCLSFMAVGPTREARLEELKQYAAIANQFIYYHGRGKWALQLNYGCPNTGHAVEKLYDEIKDGLAIVNSRLRVPIILNFQPTVPVSLLVEIDRLGGCDALLIGNTIPWGAASIDWKGIFGTTESPLLKRGFEQPGGLSGHDCLPITTITVRLARDNGVRMPIIAGNGILSARDARAIIRAGADAINVGCVGMLRPWRMRSIVAAVNVLFE